MWVASYLKLFVSVNQTFSTQTIKLWNKRDSLPECESSILQPFFLASVHTANSLTLPWYPLQVTLTQGTTIIWNCKINMNNQSI